jgi:RimJ/RimL family protein N-acetyltransferase
MEPELFFQSFEPTGLEEKLFSHQDYDFYMLGKISYEEFENFLNSLDEEKNTWSLDLQSFKNPKEFYNNLKDYRVGPMIAMKDDEMVAMYGCCTAPFMDKKKPTELVSMTGIDLLIPHINKGVMLHYSYVVKKEHQRKGLATIGLSSLIKMKEEQFYTNLVTMSDGSPIDIEVLIHEARTDNINLGSRFLLKKLGFLPIVKNEKQITYAKVFANIPLKVVQCCTIIPEQMETEVDIIMDNDLLNIKN